MQQNFQTTKFPTAASQTTFTGGATWQNPTNILADDSNDATIGLAGSGAASLFAKTFGMEVPEFGVIDGISVYVDVPFQFGGWGIITLETGLTGTTTKNALSLNGTHGGPTDLWGATFIDPSDLSNLEIELFADGTVDDIIYVNYITVTVYWHIDIDAAPTEVQSKIAYKVYSRDGNYIGDLPNVVSPFAFAQDINSAGSSIEVVSATKAENTVTTEALLTDADTEILTDSDLPILATEVNTLIALGASDQTAIFKNSNRLKIWAYNYWYPNGKLIFSGQVNKISIKNTPTNNITSLMVLSDGVDLSNYIARGYPFAYTTDVSQTSDAGSFPVNFYSSGGWDTFGQTWQTGGSVTNIGAIVLKLKGIATVTVSVYDNPSGNLIGSVTRSVNTGSPTAIQFEFPQLIEVSPSTSYFFAVWLAKGQTIDMYRATTNVYANGIRYRSLYGGGSGGGAFQDTVGGDLYFITKSGVPTTTTTFSTDDPVTDMMSGILLDYNARGGYITERDFDATGLSLTYTFNMAFIVDALAKVLEMSPTGYYAYIDLGTAEIDILQQSTTADYTVVRGSTAAELNLALSIEQVRNYLLLSGGDTGGGVNLYRDYQDSESAAFYGIRTVPKSDNRITLSATADAIGNTFIEENADEIQETSVVVLNTDIDITLLVPGKTIGFKNYGELIDQMVLQIVRREVNITKGFVTLTLGRLPVRMNDQIQKINRGLLNEQTINNPSSPS